MKAEYIREGKAVNPAFSNREKRAAKKANRPYDVEPYITIPVGFVEEGALAWAHCCPGYKGEPPMCKPADEECRVRVQQWMEVERPAQLERIRQMLRPSNLEKLNKKQREHVIELAETYGLEAPRPGEPAPVIPPSPKPLAS